MLADFWTGVSIRKNDDGDLTYYKRRQPEERRTWIRGTGQVTQGPPRPRPQTARAAPALPSGMTAMPSAEVGANGFPTIQMIDGKVPAALGLPNPNVQAILAGATPHSGSNELFQLEWVDA